MTFELLEKSPEVAPLLVKLYDTHNLYALAENKGCSESCAELTAIMTDLLSIRLSDRESELITDVLLALMKKAETDLKAALADRLAALDQAPLRMILALANDDIAVADPILRASPVLHDLDLIYILQAKGFEHGRSIALRADLSSTLIDMLADTEDFEIALNLANNDAISLTAHAYEIFSDMAKTEQALAQPLLTRDDLPQDIAGKLYSFVSAELKKMLTEKYGIGGQVSAALDQVTAEISEGSASATRANYEQLSSYVHNQLRRGELKPAGMISTLRRGQYSTFLAQFAVYCGLSIDMMRGVLRQESGKALATACRAKEISKADYVSLFLLTERFRTGGAKKVVNHQELGRIMSMFDDIDPASARQILADSRN